MEKAQENRKLNAEKTLFLSIRTNLTNDRKAQMLKNDL